QGPEVLKDLFEALQGDFSDIHVSIGDQIAEDDRVVTPVTWQCTFESNDPSTPTQVITIVGVGIDRIESGKIAESWNMYDVIYRLLNKLELSDPLPSGPVPGKPCPCDPGYICQSGSCEPRANRL